MPGLISKSHSEELDFELFSNIVLKFTAILMVVLVLLAINVGQRLDQVISPYRFSGGLARPQLYLGAYAPQDWNNVHAKMLVILYSVSFFEASTVVDPNTKQVSTKRQAETVSGLYANNPYPTLELLAGISPGSIPVDGNQTPFVVPHFSPKHQVYSDKSGNNRSSPPSDKLATSFLKLWSNTYANPIYPTRAFSEYKNIKTRIYVETRTFSGEHQFLVGDQFFSSAQIKAGQLDFLTSLSSTNTEVVYLGDYHRINVGQTESRLDFYARNGFVDAAKHLRSRLFPADAERVVAKDYHNLLPGWQQLSAEQQSSWLRGAKNDATLAREQYEASMTRRADSDYRNSLLEDAIVKNVAPDPYGLPTSLAYPAAWQAYVDFRMKASATPPEWFVTEFLQPLGFDKRVVVLEQ